jgi:predicted DNA-binding transcriptional regulator AlpA
MMDTVEDRLVSTRTIAEMLDFSITHVRDVMTKRRGFPKPIHIGGAKRYSWKEVVTWVKEQQR